MSQKKAKAVRQAERLKVWKIDVRPYQVELPVRDEKTGNMETKKAPFDVKGSVAAILFNRDLKLTVDESFTAKALADKIRAAKDHVLLDSGEMKRVREAYSIIRGPAEHELEFLRRIKDAVEVEAAEVVEEEEPSK